MLNLPLVDCKMPLGHAVEKSHEEDDGDEGGFLHTNGQHGGDKENDTKHLIKVKVAESHRGKEFGFLLVAC